MATRTVETLRALARSRGIKGYSKLKRAELERLLAGSVEPRPPKPEKSKKAAPRKKSTPDKPGPVRATAKAARPRRQAKTAAKPKKTPQTVPPPAPAEPRPVFRFMSGSDEERVENAKYATVLPGDVAPTAAGTDLGEDIDHLPPAAEPMLCLLPQKPGVLHGYWVIPPDMSPPLRSLKLRLGRIAGDRFEVIEEVALPRESGHWYFHLDESADMDAVYLQLGYYEPGGNFVSAIRRGIARIPGLYASGQTDRQWWVSEEQFRAMYLRTGGFTHDARLGWAGSFSSPGIAQGPSSERPRGKARR